MHELPDDLATPRGDHHILANIIVGVALLVILGGVVAFALLIGGR
jgi:hypothetical protein